MLLKKILNTSNTRQNAY